MNVPKLRFGEFFANKWNNKQLVNICDMRAGKFVRASEINGDFDEGLYPCYGGNGLRGFTKSFTHEGKHSLIGRQGALCGNVTLAINKFHATEHAVVVSASEGVSTDWLFYALGRLNLNQYATGQAQPGLSVENLEKVELSISDSEKEQQKIADFLSAVDEKITALTAQKTALTHYKQGMMQRIFAQTLRFKDDNGADYPEWDRTSLSQLGTTYGGLTGKTKEDFGIGKPFITYKQVFDDSKIDISRFEHVQISKDETQNRVKRGDIIFTTSSETANEIAFSSVLLDEFDELYLNSFCFGYRPNSLETFLPEYARYLFRSEFLRKEIIMLAQGSTRYNISKNQLMKLHIPLPSMPEQTKIAQFLTELDDKINAVDAQIQSAQQWKQGLLQQMFV